MQGQASGLQEQMVNFNLSALRIYLSGNMSFLAWEVILRHSVCRCPSTNRHRHEHHRAHRSTPCDEEAAL
jgi:hypothetical protein